MICLVVLNYNDADTTCHFVKQIVAYNIIDKIIIVDNTSTDDSYSKLLLLKSEKIDVLETDKNGGYGYGNNFGIRYAYHECHATHIIVSNPDVEVTEETIIHCKTSMDAFGCAIIAPMMKNDDNNVNYNCVWKIPTRMQGLLFSTTVLGRLISSIYYPIDELNPSNNQKKVGCVAGSFFMVDAEKMIQHGMFDDNIFLYCEETVLGLKMQKAELEVLVLLDDFFIHHHSVSIRKSIPSTMTQRKLTWKSRLYVLENYYSSNWLNCTVDRLISKIELFEYWLYCLKRKKNRIE